MTTIAHLIAQARTCGSKRSVYIENAVRWDYALPLFHNRLYPTIPLSPGTDHNYVNLSGNVLACGDAEDNTRLAAATLAQFLTIANTNGFYIGGPEWVRQDFEGAPGLIKTYECTAEGINDVLVYTENQVARDSAAPLLVVVDDPREVAVPLIVDLLDFAADDPNMYLVYTAPDVSEVPKQVLMACTTRLAFGQITSEKMSILFPAWSGGDELKTENLQPAMGIHGEAWDSRVTPVWLKAIH